MDLIYAARYTEICDYAWHDYADKVNAHHLTLPGGIWYVDTSAIPQFFSTITNMFNRNRRYVVVSPSCDFGVCYQRYNPPCMDLEKWVGLQMTLDHGYSGLRMAPRVNIDRCNPADTYSIKCWSWTEATFDKIPDNVLHWFMVNCDIDDPRVTAIPFGVFGNKDNLDNANAMWPDRVDERDKLLYVNFQFYTTDRYRLYKHFEHVFGDLVTCEQSVDFDHFLNQLATHKFVLCPPGNGPDCYRTLEAMYMGAIPILEARAGCVEPYTEADYPILVYPNLFMVDPRGLDGVYTSLMSRRTKDLTNVLWPYWKDRILQWQSQL